MLGRVTSWRARGPVGGIRLLSHCVKPGRRLALSRPQHHSCTDSGSLQALEDLPQVVPRSSLRLRGSSGSGHEPQESDSPAAMWKGVQDMPGLLLPLPQESW